MDARTGYDVWTDERGGKVEIKAFFSQLYVDEEMRQLTRKYEVHRCDGVPRCSSLGDGTVEHQVASILGLTLIGRDNAISLYGVCREELGYFVERCPSEHWSIRELIEEGYLREKWVAGTLVVFPTEKLLINQRIPRRQPMAR